MDISECYPRLRRPEGPRAGVSPPHGGTLETAAYVRSDCDLTLTRHSASVRRLARAILRSLRRGFILALVASLRSRRPDASTRAFRPSDSQRQVVSHSPRQAGCPAGRVRSVI